MLTVRRAQSQHGRLHVVEIIIHFRLIVVIVWHWPCVKQIFWNSRKLLLFVAVECLRLQHTNLITTTTTTTTV